MKKQAQARKSMMYQRFWEEDVTRISRTVQNIPQDLRDTLRWADAMYYLAHLALPAIVALITALSGTQIELNLSWFARTTEKLAELYMIFAAPHWSWAAISGYFEASKGATVGGFIGLHLLLFSVWFLVAQSSESHAANGWFIYFLGAPIVIAIGAIAGRFIASWKTRQSA